MVGQFRQNLLATVSCAAVLTGAAIAPAAAQQPIFTWTGFYVGVNGGGGYNRADFTSVNVGGGFYFPGSPNFFDSNNLSATAGALAGYSWQNGNLVFGLEADMSWIDGSASTTLPGGFHTASTSMNWYSTARVRVGFATGSPFLVYVTGGVAISDISNSARNTASTQSFNSSDVRVAPVFGAGFEFKVAQNVNFRVEGLFSSFGNRSVTIDDGGTYKTNFNNKLSVVRGAVTWAW